MQRTPQVSLEGLALISTDASEVADLSDHNERSGSQALPLAGTTEPVCSDQDHGWQLQRAPHSDRRGQRSATPALAK